MNETTGVHYNELQKSKIESINNEIDKSNKIIESVDKNDKDDTLIKVTKQKYKRIRKIKNEKMRLCNEHRYEIAYYVKNTIANKPGTIGYELGNSIPIMKRRSYDTIEIFFDSEKYKDHQCDSSNAMKRILSDVLHVNVIDIYDGIKNEGRYVIYYELKENIFQRILSNWKSAFS